MNQLTSLVTKHNAFLFAIKLKNKMTNYTNMNWNTKFANIKKYFTLVKLLIKFLSRQFALLSRQFALQHVKLPVFKFQKSFATQKRFWSNLNSVDLMTNLVSAFLGVISVHSKKCVAFSPTAKGSFRNTETYQFT